MTHLILIWYIVVGLVYTGAIHYTDHDLYELTMAEWKTFEFWLVFFALVVSWPYTIYSRHFS